MDYQPKKLSRRILELAGGFALAAFLLRLGVGFILAVWPALLILSAIAVAITVAYRFWKSKVE